MISLVLGIHLTTILIGWQQHQRRRTQLHSTSFLFSAFSFWWPWSSLSSASSKGLIIYRSIENYFFCRERMVKRMNKSGSESCTSWNTNSLKDLEVGVFIQISLLFRLHELFILRFWATTIVCLSFCRWENQTISRFRALKTKTDRSVVQISC